MHNSKFMVTLSKDNKYYLGNNGQYVLDISSLGHIVTGDIACTDKGFKKIKSGMHTCSGWINFRKTRPDIVHARIYEPEQDQDWFFARELSNGVILLKLPNSAIRSDNAKLTKKAEIYYKSGYLWKTLFPNQYKKDIDIVSLINEALHNIDNSYPNNSKNCIVGYAITHEYQKVIRIKIRLDKNKILTAFPTWDQPYTGNVGKAFSPLDSIGCILAASTYYFDENKLIDEKLIYLSKGSIFSSMNEYLIKKNTPKFILERKMNLRYNREEKLLVREKQLEKIAISISHDEILELIKYVKDFCVCRDTIIFLKAVYNNLYFKIKKDLELKNCLSLYQNLREILYILHRYDLGHSSDFFITFVEFYFKIKFIHAGGLDLWESKRLQTFIISLLLKHPNMNSTISRYIDALSNSPARLSAYFEFNLNPFFYKDFSIISVSSLPFPLNKNHFLNFAIQTLSYNYLQWSKKDRINFFYTCLKEDGVFNKYLLGHCIEYSLGNDFEPFGYLFGELLKKIIVLDLKKPNLDNLKKIRDDYFNCLLYRKKSILYAYDNYLHTEIDYMNKQDKFTQQQVEGKHQLLWNQSLMTEFLGAIEKYSTSINDEKFKISTQKKRQEFETKRIQPPRGIPSDIKIEDRPCGRRDKLLKCLKNKY